MPRKVEPTPLTHGAFREFGDVIDINTAGEQQLINEGHTTRFHDMATLDLTAGGGRPSVNIFRSTPLNLPPTLRVMERHPLSSQMFYPLGSSPYLIAVAPAGDLDPKQIRVFIASAAQGVNYHPGTWHHYSLALNETSDFLVIDRIGDDENCEEVRLDEQDLVEVAIIEMKR